MARNEIGAAMCRKPNGQLVFGRFAEGTPMAVNVPIQCPAGSSFEGIYHTHPGGIAVPSQMDLRSGRLTGSKALCINADGDVRCYT